MNSTNYIKAEIIINEEDINKKIRIINSFENYKKENGWMNEKTDDIYANEKEIKRCEIKINGKLIPFCFYYKFNKKGIYRIKYSFPSELTNINSMFCDCNSLTKIDLSKLNANNIINMRNIFRGCYSLLNVDLSNLNSHNVTDMSDMFYECNSLKNIDLSNFNAQKVTNMRNIFRCCYSSYFNYFARI